MLKWFKIIRPATLIVALCPVLLAVFMALQQAEINYWVAMCVLITGVTIQVVSNLVNDYYDFKKGSDSHETLGRDRLLVTGVISPQGMLRAIFIAMGIVVLGGLYLVYIGGWVILAIGVSAIIFAWLYTATNYSLSYLGIADIFVFIYFGPIAMLGTLYLLGCSWQMGALVGVGHGLISMGVLTVNNIRDIAQDCKNNKKTIIVRLGTTFGKYYYLFLLFAPQVILYFTTQSFVSCLYLPFAVFVYLQFLAAKGRAYNRVLAFTSMLNIPYMVVYMIAVSV